MFLSYLLVFSCLAYGAMSPGLDDALISTFIGNRLTRAVAIKFFAPTILIESYVFAAISAAIEKVCYQVCVYNGDSSSEFRYMFLTRSVRSGGADWYYRVGQREVECWGRKHCEDYIRFQLFVTGWKCPWLVYNPKTGRIIGSAHCHVFAELDLTPDVALECLEYAENSLSPMDCGKLRNILVGQSPNHDTYDLDIVENEIENVRKAYGKEVKIFPDITWERPPFSNLDPDNI